MGSVGPTLLDHYRSKTQADWDSLDLTGYDENGPWEDATSNQYEIFAVTSMPENADILKKSIDLAPSIQSEFPEVTFEELVFDICAAYLAVRIAPKLNGNVHLMANPRHSFSIRRVVEHGRRYHRLCEMLDPAFDHKSRLVMKIAATWEGMQAARQLKDEGIKSLATTVFTKEQVILAGEVGCVSISPFIHELKAVFDETYHEYGGPIFDLVVAAQAYYERNQIPTRVKACACLNIEEIMQTTGVHAFTAPPSDLAALSRTTYSAETCPPGYFDNPAKSAQINPSGVSYIDDEAKYRVDFAASDDGANQYKLMQAMAIFCDYQDKGLVMIRNATAGNNNRIK